jgi:hypothetical protein
MLFILLLLVGLLAHTHDWSVEWIVSMMFVLPIESRIAEVAGLTPHYLLAGHGTAVILLHLYPQTSLMCMAIIPHKRGKIVLRAAHAPQDSLMVIYSAPTAASVQFRACHAPSQH